MGYKYVGPNNLYRLTLDEISRLWSAHVRKQERQKEQTRTDAGSLSESEYDASESRSEWLSGFQ